MQKCVLYIYIQDAPFFQPHIAADFILSHPNMYIDYVNVEQVMHSSRIPYDFTYMIPVDNMANYDYEVIPEILSGKV